MNYKIEKNIPVSKNYAGRSAKYPFGEMEIGDSVLIEGLKSKPVVAASAYGKNNGKKFSSRAEGNGFRIWRIS